MEMDLFLAPKLLGAPFRKTLIHTGMEQCGCHSIKWLGSWNDVILVESPAKGLNQLRRNPTFHVPAVHQEQCWGWDYIVRESCFST